MMRPPRPNPVVHLELHTTEREAAAELYRELCGWQPHRVAAPHGTYLTLETGAGPGAGVVNCPATRPLWLPYVEVAEIGAATARAEALGASVLLGPREGSAGWRTVVRTPQGGEIAFWQPKR